MLSKRRGGRAEGRLGRLRNHGCFECRWTQCTRGHRKDGLPRCTVKHLGPLGRVLKWSGVLGIEVVVLEWLRRVGSLLRGSTEQSLLLLASLVQSLGDCYGLISIYVYIRCKCFRVERVRYGEEIAASKYKTRTILRVLLARQSLDTG